MSADVIRFTGEWHGRGRKTSPAMRLAEDRAMFDARQIKEAKEGNDDWTARLLLALLKTLDHKQLWRLEFSLLDQESLLGGASARQALAIIQLANGDKEHRERVRAMLDRIGGGSN